MFRFRRASGKIEDIWFRCDRPLMEIAELVGLSSASHDHENYWEWVVGELRDHRIDITRTHKQPAGEVDTRLFLLDEDLIGDSLKSELVERLAPVVSSGIKCGRWISRKGHDFEKVVVEEFPSASPDNPLKGSQP